MKILCQTLFDCSYTGVTGNFKISQVPFRDRAGQTIADLNDWHRSRNQQRNYETLLQIFGLRTQPQEITPPVCTGNKWEFSFESETEAVFEIANNPDPLAGLKQDCDGVPMVLKLQEHTITLPVLTTAGTNQNIWFKTINK